MVVTNTSPTNNDSATGTAPIAIARARAGSGAPAARTAISNPRATQGSCAPATSSTPTFQALTVNPDSAHAVAATSAATRPSPSRRASSMNPRPPQTTWASHTQLTTRGSEPGARVARYPGYHTPYRGLAAIGTPSPSAGFQATESPAPTAARTKARAGNTQLLRSR